MKRILHAGASLLLLAFAGLGAQTAEAARRSRRRGRATAASASPAAKQPNGFKNGEAPKGGGGPRLGQPGNPVERLMAMPPEQRERVLEKLPAAQQANLRQRLDRFDKLPPEERARLNQMLATFNNLSPEKKAIVTRQMQAFNALPVERREELGPVLQRLRRMPEEQRQEVLNREQFKSRFSASGGRCCPTSPRTITRQVARAKSPLQRKPIVIS